MKKQIRLTRGTKKIIAEAIANLPQDKKTNCYSICEEVSNILIERFIGDPNDDDFEMKSNKCGILDYQIQRMGLRTTNEIMEKIELYMINLLENRKRKSNQIYE